MEHKVIDFHTHVFPDKIAQNTIAYLSEKGGIPPFSDGTADGLRKTLKKARVSMGVVLPVVTKPEQFNSITNFALSINDQNSEQNREDTVSLLSFGGIHPFSSDIRGELQTLKKFGFKGIKIHPDYQGVDFDDIRYKRIIDVASELDLIVVTHAGVDVGFRDTVRCTPTMALRVLREVRPRKLVLAHTGGFALWEDVLQKLCGEEVYFDTAYTMSHIDSEMFVKICRAHDINKILFATDCPWGNPEQDLKTFLRMPFTAREQKKILSVNALRLLNMEK